MERIQKVIAASGICSRRKAEELILEGRVSVNGNVISTLGYKVDENDKIEVNGKELTKETKEYYILNKPKGYICTSKDTHGRKTVVDLIKTNSRLFTVGRLDYDTTGLILLTNDGELSNHLIHPRYGISKEYQALVSPSISQNQIDLLTKGFNLEDGFVRAIEAKIVQNNSKNSQISIKISVGKKHIIKRMIKYIGSSVLELHRSNLAFLDLKNLNVGQYRKLSYEEIKKLKEL